MIGDRLGHRRIHLVVGLMGALGVLYPLMGPWQLSSFDATGRRVALYLYLIADGGISCLIEPQLVPHMLSVAEQRSRATGGGGPSEHLTNSATSIAQFANNAGAVAGPFLAVPIIEMVGFRGALAAWGLAYIAVIAAGVILRTAGSILRGTGTRCGGRHWQREVAEADEVTGSELAGKAF